jgi:hypothetical protein
MLANRRSLRLPFETRRMAVQEYGILVLRLCAQDERRLGDSDAYDYTQIALRVKLALPLIEEYLAEFPGGEAEKLLGKMKSVLD